MKSRLKILTALLSTLCCILLLFSCSGTGRTNPGKSENMTAVDNIKQDKGNSNAQKDDEKKSPIITSMQVFCSMNNYPGSLIFQIIEGNVKIPASALSSRVHINFDVPLDESCIKSAVSSSNIKDMDFSLEDYGKTLVISIGKLDEVKQYKIAIGRDIKSRDGISYGEDIKITITPVEEVKARYKVYGTNTLEYPDGVLPPVIYGDEEQLTDEPKRLEISFTGDVDKKSVETVVKGGIPEKEAEYTMGWKDDRTLDVDFKSFRCTNTISISMTYADDILGMPIVNDFYFTAGKVNELYYYDVLEDTVCRIKTFHDRRFYAGPSQNLGRWWLLSEQYDSYLYDREQDKIEPLKERADIYVGSPWGPDILWLDEDTILFYVYEPKQIKAYSFDDNKEWTLVDMSNYLGNMNVFDIKLSPDGQKIAVAAMEEEKSHVHQIYVFYIKGDLLYKSGRIENVQVSWAAGYISSLNMYWCDDENILYSVGGLNVRALNINTGKESTLFSKNDQNPFQAYPYYFSALKYDSESTNPGKCLYLAADDGHKPYLTCGENVGGIYILAGTKTAYNTDNYKPEGENSDALGLDGFVIYDMKTKSEKFIKDANIIGVSKDGTKIFYMTNNRLLHPIS